MQTRPLSAIAAALLMASAHAQLPTGMKVDIFHWSTDPATIRAPQCLLGTKLTFKQPVGHVVGAYDNSYVVVTGSIAPEFNGLYKITRFYFTRNKAREHIDTDFDAVCIVTPNPVRN